MATGEGSSSSTTPPRWIGTELGTRIVSAVVLGIIAIAAAYAGGPAFTLFWLIGGIAVMAEWIGMTRVEPRFPTQLVLAAGLGALTVLYLYDAQPGTMVLASVATILVAAAVARGSRGRLWAIAGFAYAVVISLVPPLVRDHPELGLVGLLWMFAVVWATDIAAYFAGRRFGGPKLWPRVSPKKTWSGFFGGLIAGTLSGIVVAVLSEQWGWTPAVDLPVVVIISAIASVASQLGDLGESALKRSFDVKDSSHLIPGHGGVMDRLDGFWAVALLVGLTLLGIGFSAA
jgi:phosphatidate cytidylyltransferase